MLSGFSVELVVRCVDCMHRFSLSFARSPAWFYDSGLCRDSSYVDGRRSGSMALGSVAILPLIFFLCGGRRPGSMALGSVAILPILTDVIMVSPPQGNEGCNLARMLLSWWYLPLPTMRVVTQWDLPPAMTTVSPFPLDICRLGMSE